MDAITNCNRKEAFATKAEAEKELAALKRRIRDRGEKIQGNPVSFKCRTCYGKWHIGRKKGRRG
jgi:hypothetical protein